MNRLIMKTALITVASLLALLVLLTGALCLFAPGVMAKTASKLGLDGAALYFSEKQYVKTKEEGDLEDLLYRANAAGAYDKLVKYSLDMIDAENFDEFCAAHPASTPDYKSYVIGSYVLSLMLTGNTDGALSEAARLYAREYAGFTAFNPFDVLAKNATRFTTEQKNALLAVLNSIGSGEELLNNDITYVENAIGG